MIYCLASYYLASNVVPKEIWFVPGCHAEPRVGESIGSEHKDRNKLVKVEDRSNACEHPVLINHQEIECATAVLNRTLKWFCRFIFVWFQKNFCI